jgi:hypothetical protein
MLPISSYRLTPLSHIFLQVIIKVLQPPESDWLEPGDENGKCYALRWDIPR